MSEIKYSIPVIWEVWGMISVYADSLDEAKEKVLSGPLPHDGEYIDDSFVIDEEGIPDFNKEIIGEK